MYVISFNFVNPNQMHFYSHFFYIIDFEEMEMRVGRGRSYLKQVNTVELG